MAAPPRQQIAWAQKYGKQYGVDPKLLLAIGGFETRWGTLGAGRPSQSGYVLGYGRGTSRYSGPENQYRYAAQTLAGWGAKTLADLQAGKAAAWTPDSWWKQGVTDIYKGLPQLGAAPTSPATGTAPPSTVPPTTRTAPPTTRTSPVTTAPSGPAPLAEIPAHILESVNRSLAGTLSPALGGPTSAVSVKPLELAKFVPKLPPTLPPPMPLQPVTPQGVPTTRTPTNQEIATASPLGQHIVKAAASQLGQPYVWGGESRKEGGFDCSGLIDAALRANGVKLPFRVTTYTALKLGRSVKGQPLKAGDMIITHNGKHMVLYAGNGKVIAAPHTGAVVQYQPVGEFLQNGLVDVRRV